MPSFTTTDRSESEIIASSPIKFELDCLRRRFRSQCNDLGISESEDPSTQVVLWIGNDSADTHNDILDLLGTLQFLPAARTIKSRTSFWRSCVHLLSSQFIYGGCQLTIPLLTQVTKPAPDVAIWNAVFALVAIPTTTPPTSFRNVDPSTTFKSTACSQQGSEQTHADIDNRILQEVNLCTYQDTEGFYEKYFGNKSWSSPVARFAQEVNPQTLNGRWVDYPSPPTQTAFLEWFWKFQATFPPERRNTYYTSFNKPLNGSSCHRQPDLFLAISGTSTRGGKYNWRDVRVIGELKESVSRNFPQEVAKFCGYAREVFTNQPTRLFLHGFVLRGSIMELWICDRSGPYSCERFDAHKDPDRFIKVIVGYTMMSEDELGLDTFIKQDKIGKWIMFQGEGKTTEERLYLEDQPMALQQAIVCRGTTCYRAKRQTGSRWEFVVKFSWRSDKRRAEGELLQLAKKRHVWGVAEPFGHQDLSSVADLREGLKFGEPRSFPLVSSGLLNQTQSNPISDISKGNQSQLSTPGSSTMTLPSSSSLRQKRKRLRETTAIRQSKRSKSGGGPSKDTLSKATEASDDTGYPVEENKTTSLMPLKDNESFDNRIFCCLVVSPPGRAIDRFKSIGEYLEACRYAIKGHRSLYQDAKILHGDVSMNNIIIADAENDADPRGMLIDLDLAKELNSGLSGASHRTGTMEFMAIEVLQGYAHTYRHDLESFFYVFLWIIIRYIPEGSKRYLAKESKLRRWYTGSYDDIAHAKRSHMDKDRFNVILNEFPPEFDCLKELAKELRMALFPIRRGALFTGTWSDHKRLYITMVNAFDKAILKVSG